MRIKIAYNIFKLVCDIFHVKMRVDDDYGIIIVGR